MDKIESLCKALRCIASFNGYGDCYREQHSKQRRTEEAKGPKVICGINPPEGYIICPYYQDDYGVCAEDGELFWLSEVADILEGKTTADKISLSNAKAIPVWKMVWAVEPEREIDVRMTYDDLKRICEGDKTGEWAGTVCTSCGASVSNYYDCDYCPNCGSKNA